MGEIDQTPQPPERDTSNVSDDAQPLSPIRPTVSAEQKSAQPRLIPKKPGTGGLPAEKEEVTPPEIQETLEINPQEALERLRNRLAHVANEFAEGRINRAQFYAIYARYNEQRDIVEQLLARDPQSQAWQQVVRPGHTSFLRQHFEARMVFFALYPLGQVTPIIQWGKTAPKTEEITPILRALPGFLKKRGALGPARKEIGAGRWLMIAPGKHTATIMLYSLEPSAQQVRQMADLHNDFERANIHTLERGDFERTRLVFPQRALFEEDAQ